MQEVEGSSRRENSAKRVRVRGGNKQQKKENTIGENVKL
jgi:hypothetical protein